MKNLKRLFVLLMMISVFAFGVVNAEELVEAPVDNEVLVTDDATVVTEEVTETEEVTISDNDLLGAVGYQVRDAGADVVYRDAPVVTDEEVDTDKAKGSVLTLILIVCVLLVVVVGAIVLLVVKGKKKKAN